MIVRYHTVDSPEANGRKPQPGEQKWTFRFLLENGDELRVIGGQATRDEFRNFVLREELDDAADAAVANL